MSFVILSPERRQRDFFACLSMEPMLSHEFNLQAYCALHSKVSGELERATAGLQLNFPSSGNWQTYSTEAQGRAFPFHEHRLNSKRLGLYFESLLELWLRNNCYFKLVASHVAVHDTQTKKTLGEIDWLVDNQLTQELEHWECAVKFFLVQTHCKNLYSFRGTGLKDTLGNKLNHIITHQLLQSLSPQVSKSLDNRKVTKHVCLIKGMLFFEWPTFKGSESLEPLKLLPPQVTQFLNVKTQFSHWFGASELDEYLSQFEGRTVDQALLLCIMLERLEWITPLNHSDVIGIQQHSPERIYSKNALADWATTCNSSYLPQSPVMVAVVASVAVEPSLDQPARMTEFVELSRFFLVTEEWRERFQRANFP